MSSRNIWHLRVLRVFKEATKWPLGKVSSNNPIRAGKSIYLQARGLERETLCLSTLTYRDSLRCLRAHCVKDGNIHNRANIAIVQQKTDVFDIYQCNLRLKVLLLQKVPIRLVHFRGWSLWLCLGLESTDHIMGAPVI